MSKINNTANAMEIHNTELQNLLSDFVQTFGIDATDFMKRVLGLVKTGELEPEDVDYWLKLDSEPKTIQGIAHEYREEKRLKLMLEYCALTDTSLDTLEKQTRGMHPHEVTAYLEIHQIKEPLL